MTFHAASLNQLPYWGQQRTNGLWLRLLEFHHLCSVHEDGGNWKISMNEFEMEHRQCHRNRESSLLVSPLSSSAFLILLPTSISRINWGCISWNDCGFSYRVCLSHCIAEDSSLTINASCWNSLTVIRFFSYWGACSERKNIPSRSGFFRQPA